MESWSLGPTTISETGDKTYAGITLQEPVICHVREEGGSTCLLWEELSFIELRVLVLPKGTDGVGERVLGLLGVESLQQSDGLGSVGAD